MAGTPPPLKRLRDAERAKRLFILGLLAVFYGGGWLIIAFHTGRIGEAESTVLRIYQGVHYTVTHHVDGVEYMANPGRIPDSLGRPPVGSRLHCYYYRCDPTNAFFDPRHHPWPAPIPLALLAAGVVAFGESLRRRRRSRQRPPEAPPAPPIPDAPPRAPLEIPLAKMTWPRSIVAGTFLFLTSVLAALSTWMAWGTGGDVITVVLLFVLGCHGAMLGSAFLVFYSSGLVFDSARGLLYHAWGLPRPWLRTYQPLAALLRVETESIQGRRSREYKLVLCFQDDLVWKYSLGFSLDQPFETQESVQQYLRDARP
jgi:hypothetical protein